jgi:hypothetical protein
LWQQWKRRHVAELLAGDIRYDQDLVRVAVELGNARDKVRSLQHDRIWTVRRDAVTLTQLFDAVYEVEGAGASNAEEQIDVLKKNPVRWIRQAATDYEKYLASPSPDVFAPAIGLDPEILGMPYDGQTAFLLATSRSTYQRLKSVWIEASLYGAGAGLAVLALWQWGLNWWTVGGIVLVLLAYAPLLRAAKKAMSTSQPWFPR